MQRIILSLVLVSWCVSAGAAPPVVGGSAVKRGDWPDVVAVLGADARCTGTLVAPDVVLTAGHCIEIHPQEVLVDVIDVGQPLGGERIAVKKAVAFPDWEDTFDVGVLVLEHVAKTKPRAVAATCTEDALLGSRKKVRVIGFGLTSPSGTDDNEKLHTALLPVVDARCTDDPSCQPAIAPGGEFVAGGNGTDSCFGDSGGPVMLAAASGPVLGGVVSRGLDVAGVPCGNGGVYVRADKVADWIERVTGRTLARTTCDPPGDGPGWGSAMPVTTADDGGAGGGGCAAGGAAGAELGVLGALLPIALVPGVWRRRRRATTPPR